MTDLGVEDEFAAAGGAFEDAAAPASALADADNVAEGAAAAAAALALEEPPFYMHALRMAMWLGVMLLLWLGYLYVNQESILYHPDVPGPQFKRPRDLPAQLRMNSPADRDMPFSNLLLRTRDGVRLHAWLIWAATAELRAQVPTLVFFHENAGTMALRLDNMEKVYLAFSRAVNILLVDYRGYGESEGRPTEQGLEEDAETVLRHLFDRTDIDRRRIFLWGRSLGGAVVYRWLGRHTEDAFPGSENVPLPTTETASGLPPLVWPTQAAVRGLVAGAIVENTFTSIVDMVERIFPMLAFLRHWVVRMHWNSLKVAPQIQSPMLFVSGAADQLIPPAHMQRLYAAHPGEEARFEKEFLSVPDGGHNDVWQKGGELYLQTMVRFVLRHSLTRIRLPELRGRDHGLGGGDPVEVVDDRLVELLPRSPPPARTARTTTATATATATATTGTATTGTATASAGTSTSTAATAASGPAAGTAGGVKATTGRRAETASAAVFPDGHVASESAKTSDSDDADDHMNVDHAEEGDPVGPSRRRRGAGGRRAE